MIREEAEALGSQFSYYRSYSQPVNNIILTCHFI